MSGLLALENLNMRNIQPTHQLSDAAFLNLTNLRSVNFAGSRVELEWPKPMSTASKLQSLNFSSMTYTTNLPVDLGNLRELECLDMTKTPISALPTSLGQLTRLKYLSLDYYSEMSPFPDILDQLISLESLTLHMESGPLPDSVGRLNSGLRHLTLTSKIGSIPSGISRLVSLQSLNIHSKPAVDVTLPHEIWLFPHLEDISLDILSSYSMMDGLGTANPNLKSLSLRGSLTGTIPPSLGSSSLALLKLSSQNSHLHGTIPSELGKLKFLQHLELTNTSLTGSIPPQLGNLTSLVSFYIASTTLSGTIPPELGSLSKLERFHLSDSNIGGTIPSSIGQWTSLTTFQCTGSQLSGTIPPEMGQMRNLTWLTIQEDLNGTLPVELSRCHQLKELVIRDGSITGVISEDFGQLENLTLVDMSKQSLSGQIPSFFGSLLDHIDLSNNLLSGTIPSNMNAKITVALNNNRLTGSIPPSLLGTRAVEVQNNQLSGSLPLIHQSLLHTVYFDASNNSLTGTLVPYSTMRFLRLEHNQLTGTIPGFKVVEDLQISHNQLHGGLDNVLFHSILLKNLWANNNQLNGPLPALNRRPINLQEFDISHNQMHGTIPDIVLQPLAPVTIDFSHNLFTGDFPVIKISPPSVSAGNQIIALDISFNPFGGTIPQSITPLYKSLRSLSLASTSFSSGLEALGHLALEYLNLDNTNFNSPISSLYALRHIPFISARNAGFYGSFRASLMTNTRYLDLSSNRLNEPLDLEDLRFAFQQQHMVFLSLSGNPDIPPLDSLDQLFLDNVSHPLPDATHSSCFHVGLSTDPNTIFLYDDQLFSWLQCHCDEKWFGIAPFACFSCPNDATCIGRQITIAPNYYAYPTYHIPSVGPIAVEPCASGLLAEFTNCRTSTLEITNVSTLNNPASIERMDQCQLGSDGRLCTRCICNAAPADCYFPVGQLCKRCSKRFNDTQSGFFFGSLLFLSIAVLTVTSYLVMGSKRRRRQESWKVLPLHYRIFQRIMFATTMGFAPILINFVQISAGLSHWNDYGIRALLSLSNGQLEAIGVRCLIPALNNSLFDFAADLSLPLVAIAVVVLSVVLAEMPHFCSRKRASRHGLDDSLMMSYVEHDNRRRSREVYYPATALMTNLGISVVQFFYFGTAVTSTKYFFWDKQDHTKELFVSSEPWMKFSEARKLRILSIPFLILYVAGVPFVYLIVTWKLRHKLESHAVTQYAGSLYSRYQVKTSWWEIVQIAKKLLLSICLRALEPMSAVLAGAVLLIIGTSAYFQSGLRPWKRNVENWIDQLASFLLLANYLANPQSSDIITITVIVCNIVFFLSVSAIWIRAAVMEKTDYETQWLAQQEMLQGPAMVQDDDTTSENKKRHSDPFESFNEAPNSKHAMGMDESSYFTMSDTEDVTDSDHA